MQDIESSDISCHNFPENEAESPYLRVFKYLSERPSLLSLKLVLIALAALQRYVIGTGYTYLRCDWFIRLAV